MRYTLLVLLLWSSTLSFSQEVVLRDYRITVYYASNAAELSPQEQQQFFQRLQAHSHKAIQDIRIIGHTDQQGSHAYNEALSQRRANYIHHLLLEKSWGDYPIALSYQGETQPRIIGDTPQALASNRRVDVVLSVREVLPPKYDTLSVVHHPAPQPQPAPTSQTEEEAPLSPYWQFHQKLDQRPQTFQLDNEKGGWVEGKKGTILHFPAQLFCDCKTGEPISGSLDILLKEYYSLGDFLKAGLSTNAHQKMLQSAGSIHLDAQLNGTPVCLQKEGSYRILFPDDNMNAKPYKDMNLFVGNVTDNGVNWGVLAANGLENPKEVMEHYSEIKCGTIDYGYGSRRKRSFLNQCYLFVFKHRRWRRYKGFGIPKRLDAPEDIEDIMANADNIEKAIEEAYPEFAKEVRKSGRNLKEYAMNYYINRSNRLGYMNCDRFYKIPANQKLLVKLPMKYQKGVVAQVVVKKYNGILRAYNKKGKITFGYLPKGKKATLILYDYMGDTPRMAQHDFRIGDTITAEDIALKDSSLAAIKKTFSTL